MLDTPYRILSPTAILGYGFPKASFEKAMKLKLNLIAVDAGSIDAGPYYLGTGKQYVANAALRRDLQLMIRGAILQQCPLIIGSAGFSGASQGVDDVVSVVKRILREEKVKRMKLAVIKSDIAPSILKDYWKELKPLGKMPPLDRELLENSRMVGQMGIEPIVAALDAGAQIIVCGRAYDPAVFAADPIRKGFPKGAAFHAAKILECGAIACTPGSGSDCLIAELYRAGKAIFYPTNEHRKATIKSIAAHTLYEKSRPDFFYMPGGILSIQQTKFFQIDDQKAGFIGSEFIPRPPSIKIEGSEYLGERIVSIVSVKNAEEIDPSIRVYGKNGVESIPTTNANQEIGIIAIVKSQEKTMATDALAFIRSTILHYGYQGRVSTAGNLAFPFSPSDMLFEDEAGNYVALFVAGTRDPYFQREWLNIKATILNSLEAQHPVLFENCSVEFILADKQNPIAILENISNDLPKARKADQNGLKAITPYLDESRPCFKGIYMGSCFRWSVHHLIDDMEIIQQLFKLECEELIEGKWKMVSAPTINYANDEKGRGEVDKKKHELNHELSQVAPFQTIPLKELADVIRSKNAGINEITFDILFKSEDVYRKAIQSGAFSKGNLARVLNIHPDRFIGCYTYEPVWAIKITAEREILNGSLGDRDVFGAQRHVGLLALGIS